MTTKDKRIRPVSAGLAALVAGALVLVAQPPTALAVSPEGGEAAPAEAAPVALSAAELEQIVGRIALYPDDLVAIILPASTYPVDVVKAARFLPKLEKDKSLQPDPAWHETVVSLLNYPDVLNMMNQDLDWTWALGEAVVNQQADVMDAIQSFRRKTESAGNLHNDDKQTVVVEKEVIKIVQADPQVIYIPQYDPQVVVVRQPATTVVYGYYPTPYPVYYRSYPPGYGFAAGFFFGAAVSYGIGWGRRDIDVNRNTNINVSRGDVNIGSGNRPGGGGSTWKPGAGGGNRPGAGNRPGGGNRPGAGNRPGSGNRPGTGSRPGGATRPATGGGRPGAGTGGSRPGASAGGRPSTRPSSRPSTQPSRRAGSSGGGAFGGYQNGNRAGASSARGSSSRRSSSRGASSRGSSSRGSSSRGGRAPSGGARRGGGGGRRR
jgi:hypothetical protein